ncbi:ABC transporter permease [Demequina sediminicola]|uniref:ABC transporter permease n=1 Tax=Demequina sediminicola TaxID=1095026 RepID=UPI0009E5636B|nr:proline/glycine betaine ABC transporter permease [Demequina sediminicola]
MDITFNLFGGTVHLWPWPPSIPFDVWIENFFDWFKETFAAFFDALSVVFETVFNAIDWVLSYPPDWAFILIAAIAALFARGRKFAIGTAIALVFIVSVGQWENAIATLALVLVATLAATLIAIPLGIWAARNDRVSAFVKPLMDLLQTLPAFVYLVPALALFGIGVAPGILATVIFAVAPGVRLTELGIRGVDKEVIEAGQAFGATPGRILRQIQIPLAMPSIMAGINQVIMLSLSMVVIAGMVGAPGLGDPVTEAVLTLDEGLGFEAGLSVVFLAIILDRFTASVGKGMGLYAQLAKARKQRRETAEQARIDAEIVEMEAHSAESTIATPAGDNSKV